MGREKSAPKKREAPAGVSSEPYNCYNYIPVVKKRKINKKPFPEQFFKVTLPNDVDKEFYVGYLFIGTTNNIFPDKFSACKVSFKQAEEEADVLVLQCDENTYIVVNLTIETAFLRELVKTKIFIFEFWTKEEEVYINVYITLPLPNFTARIGNTIKILFKLLYDIEDNTAKENKNHLHGNAEVIRLYNKLMDMRERDVDISDEDTQHPFLKPILRPYQIQAVKWMLHRERTNLFEEDTLYPLYEPVVLKSGKTVYFDKFTGYVCLEKPVIGSSYKGGILADEMGLGKTVEVLACILLNTKNKSISANLNKKPTIKILKKKKMQQEDTESDVEEVKVFKVPKNWAKKSNTYIALQLWYDNLLSEVTTNPSRSNADRDGLLIQCVCGSVKEFGLVECDSCGKYQHQMCLGYNKKFGRYLCPQCWMDEPLIECGATLIITPISLRTQWCNEICKHIQGNLKVLQYEGVSSSPIYPTQFGEFDIIITTYNVLQSEFRLTENLQTMNFRRERKYSPPGCPLIRVKWWRLCLDEAQTVEIPGKIVSEMANKISAHYRWAITGTPISKNISDLYGLVSYLQIYPYSDLNTWRHILYKPYMSGDDKPMVNFLSKVLWRTAKKDVLNQINIPRQTFKEYKLEFSAVEKYFYKREHELSSSDFLARVRKFDDSSLVLERLDKRVLKQLMAPLLSLRHACTHPNTAKGRYLVTKKQVTSIKDLLDALISKNIADCEECLRLIISSLNGLAGVHLLLKEHQQAIDYYRNVLQLAARFSGNSQETKLTVDKLQLIHTMYNLAEVIEIHPPKEPTLRDSTLQQDQMEMEKQYMDKFINDATTAYEGFTTILNNIESIKEKFVLKDGQWYSDGLDWIYCHNYYEDLLDRLQVACDNANITCIARNTTERQVLKILYSWMDDVTDLRIKLFQTIDKLYTRDPVSGKVLVNQELVKSVMDCHLRPQVSKSKPTLCLFCVTNNKLKKYEGKLFYILQRKKTFEEMSLLGSWKPTQEELIFKSLLALLKSKNGDSNFINDGELNIKMIDLLKKEFKEVRKFWTFLDSQICAQDELDICKVRLQLKNSCNQDVTKTSKLIKNLSYAVENKHETVHLLSVHELDYQDSFLRNEVNINMGKLEKYLGTQNYLETLRKQQYEGQNPDPCPICKNPLEHHWSILLCGHSYCLDCIRILLEQTMGNNIQCSVCRNKQKFQDISYIKLGASVTKEDELQIEGNYSTKIESVIKLLFELRSDPKVKVLLFSSWVTVLKNLQEALSKNKIVCELAQSTDLVNKIESFKDPKKEVTVLLLPINLGSKGLNLIEATHVILVEPLLNPADELQAIGRVHRIGQTKPTVVHKFLIKDTIEESIYQATTSDADSWDKNKVTLQHLINLFKNETFSESTEDVSEVEHSEIDTDEHRIDHATTSSIPQELDAEIMTFENTEVATLEREISLEIDDCCIKSETLQENHNTNLSENMLEGNNPEIDFIVNATTSKTSQNIVGKTMALENTKIVKLESTLEINSCGIKSKTFNDDFSVNLSESMTDENADVKSENLSEIDYIQRSTISRDV